jgi:hypothetical protein
MDLESTKKLRLDRRLVRRRGWIPAAELEAAIESLPDVSEKVAPPEESDDSRDQAAGAAVAGSAAPGSTGQTADSAPEGGAPV